MSDDDALREVAERNADHIEALADALAVELDGTGQSRKRAKFLFGGDAVPGGDRQKDAAETGNETADLIVKNARNLERLRESVADDGGTDTETAKFMGLK